MKPVRAIASFYALCCSLVLLAGCSRDPNVRKQKYLESGERYFAKSEYRAAAIQFRNALQADPKFAPAHYQLARTYLKLQDWNNAYSELSTTVELQPDNNDARLDLANLLIASGDLKQAQTQIDVLSGKEADSADVYLARAGLLAAQQQVPNAIQELEKAIALKPQRGDLYLSLALLQVRSNLLDGAERNFKKAIELTPKPMAAELMLAGYYQSQRRYPDAEQQLLRADEIDRHDPEPSIALARLYMVEGNKSAAENLLKKSKPAFPDNPVGYRMLGDFYFAVADYDNAIREYSELHRQHPKDLVVSNNYVQLLIIKNRLDEATKLNDSVLKSKPGDVGALVNRGQIEIALGHLSNAMKTLQTAINNDPNSGPAYYQLGVAYDRARQPEQAERAWQDAVHHRPDLIEAQRALARSALRNGDMVQVEQCSARIIALQPDNPDGYAMRALSYIRRGQLSQAEADVQKAIRVAPQSSAGYLQLGNLMLARKNFRAAQDAYQQALQRDSGSSDALAGLMNAHFAQNELAEGFEAARAQIAMVPNDGALYDLLGTALFDRKRGPQDVADAEMALTRAVQLDEHNVDGWLKLVQVQAVRDSADQAMATCQKAIAISPDEGGYYLLLGELYVSKQEWEPARQAFQKVLSLSPQNPEASNDLAYVVLQTDGNPDIAMPLAQTARRGMPDSPQAADVMGWVLYKKGAYRSAIDQFLEALKLAANAKSRENATFHYHLGMAYEKNGQVTLAREQLQRVLKINPNYPEADDVKKLLSRLSG
jgi:tetratricopeptide (TPR) repeat protein